VVKNRIPAKKNAVPRNRVKNVPRKDEKPNRRFYYMPDERPATEQTLKSPLPLKKVFFYLLVLVCASVALIWIKVQVDSTSQRVKEFSQKIIDQKSKNQYTKRELDKGITYENIYPYVSTQLGMELPKIPKILVPVPERIFLMNK
jgi:cell division protein FtsL